MPVYEYQCKVCGTAHEIKHRMHEKKKRCSICGQRKLEKQLVAAALRFVGPGFYATDYKGK
jgi:putative FmdB family regulatory protein